MFENEDIEFEDDEFDPMVDEMDPDVEMSNVLDSTAADRADGEYLTGERNQWGERTSGNYYDEVEDSFTDDDTPENDPMENAPFDEEDYEAYEGGLRGSYQNDDYAEEVDYSPDEIIQEAARIKKSGLLRG